MQKQQTVYQRGGGDDPLRRMVDAFYGGVEADPLLRRMFPADLGPGKYHQYLFIRQYFGGPAEYADLRGHPRLRMRHAPFPIDQHARDAWLGHMLAAIDEIGIAEPARTIMREYFERTATHMINNNTGGIPLTGR